MIIEIWKVIPLYRTLTRPIAVILATRRAHKLIQKPFHVWSKLVNRTIVHLKVMLAFCFLMIVVVQRLQWVIMPSKTRRYLLQLLTAGRQSFTWFFPQFISGACRNTARKFMHLATDFGRYFDIWILITRRSCHLWLKELFIWLLLLMTVLILRLMQLISSLYMLVKWILLVGNADALYFIWLIKNHVLRW